MSLKCNLRSNLYHSWKPPFVFHPWRHLWCQVGSLKLTPLSPYPSHGEGGGVDSFFWFLFFLLVTEQIALGFSLFESLLVYLGNRTSLTPPCQINPSHMTIIIITIVIIILLMMIYSGPGTTLGILYVLFCLILATTHEVGITTLTVLMRLREIMELPQGHTASKCQS